MPHDGVLVEPAAQHGAAHLDRALHVAQQLPRALVGLAQLVAPRRVRVEPQLRLCVRVRGRLRPVERLVPRAAAALGAVSGRAVAIAAAAAADVAGATRVAIPVRRALAQRVRHGGRGRARGAAQREPAHLCALVQHLACLRLATAAAAAARLGAFGRRFARCARPVGRRGSLPWWRRQSRERGWRGWRGRDRAARLVGRALLRCGAILHLQRSELQRDRVRDRAVRPVLVPHRHVGDAHLQPIEHRLRQLGRERGVLPLGVLVAHYNLLLLARGEALELRLNLGLRGLGVPRRLGLGSADDEQVLRCGSGRRQNGERAQGE